MAIFMSILKLALHLTLDIQNRHVFVPNLTANQTCMCLIESESFLGQWTLIRALRCIGLRSHKWYQRYSL